MENLPLAGFDHGLILLSTNSGDRTGKYPLFKFEAKFTRKFYATFKANLEKFVKGLSVYQLASKIDLLKKEIKVWKKLLYDNEYYDIDWLNNDLAIIRVL